MEQVSITGVSHGKHRVPGYLSIRAQIPASSRVSSPQKNVYPLATGIWRVTPLLQGEPGVLDFHGRWRRLAVLGGGRLPCFKQLPTKRLATCHYCER